MLPHVKRLALTGFTLIELLLVIMILGILSTGTFAFIGSSVQVYIDVTERDQLLSDSRFLVERMTRELRYALPNSLRLSQQGSARHCIEFVPIEGATMYMSAAVAPDIASSTVEGIIITADDYQFTTGQYAVIYATEPGHVYQLNARRIGITSIKDDDGNATTGEPTDSDGVIAIQLASPFQFPLHSPTERLYIVSQPVSYCVSANGDVTRHQGYGFLPSGSADIGLIGNGALMAENNNNPLSLLVGSDINDPFRVEQATLQRNAVVNVLLRFERNQESISFNHEIHINNAP